MTGVQTCALPILQSVTGFDLAHRQVLLAGGPLNYDYLVLALGSVPSYFAHPEWESHAPGLKSLDDALRIRREARSFRP